jgi:DNA invertase Pin-like site-specific DNA recombinase
VSHQGLDAARARGARLGRPPATTDEAAASVQRIYDRLVDKFAVEGTSYSLVRQYSVV